MNKLFENSVYFGMAISLFAYWIGYQCRKKWKRPIFNPLLIAMTLVIGFLLATGMEFETYSYGAGYLTYFLTPATVCLAVPLYRQVEILKKNVGAIFAGICCGCLTHFLVVAGVGVFVHLDRSLLFSMLPKSVTTAIALDVSSEIGGIQAITIVGVMLAGLIGAIAGPALLKRFGISEPEAQGLAIGTAAHAIGTSRAVELGEVQAAMSSLAIIVTGILTVIIVPSAVKVWELFS